MWREDYNDARTRSRPAYLGQFGAAAGFRLVKERQNVVGALHALVLFKLAVEKVQCDAVGIAACDARYQVLERSARLVNGEMHIAWNIISSCMTQKNATTK